MSSGFTRSDKLVALSKEEIKQLHPDGKEDDDGFYVLKDGDFYDPFGYYFDVEGLDVTGGSYDAQGYYISGTELAIRPLILTKEEIEKLNPDGTFDEDGFYILKDGDFYDPLGYYFDKDGYDETGGKYDDAGYYIPAPEHVDDRVQSLTKEEVLLLHPEGKFDDDGFLHL